MLGWLLILACAAWCWLRFGRRWEAPRIDKNDPTPYGRM